MALKALWPGFSYKQHQVTGVKWMLDREAAVPSGGILCDEMGLGKTIQMMGLLKETSGDKNKRETLLLAPVAVLQQWEDCAKRCRINVFRCHTTARHVEWRPVGPVNPAAPRLHLIGYEMAKHRRELITNHAWDRLICDEAHRCAAKNGFNTLVKHIPAAARWFLTATPIVNELDDLTRLLELLEVKGAALVAKTREGLKEYILARSMDDLRASIPDAPPLPIYHTRRLTFTTEEEAAFYKGMTGVIVRRWKALEEDGGAGAALMKLQLFMRLRQLSLHPQVYVAAKRKMMAPLKYNRPDWEGSSTKFEEIHRLIEAEPGRKWIIFCHFHPEMDLLEAALKEQPHVGRVWKYHGGLSHAERKEVLADTLTEAPSAGAQVLLVQLQSGGTGLNLQHFDRIIFTGPWWTAALMEQAVGRAVRIGQREVVEVYHLVLEEEEAINIDAVMREKAEEKGGLCKEILEAACRNI